MSQKNPEKTPEKTFDGKRVVIIITVFSVLLGSFLLIVNLTKTYGDEASEAEAPRKGVTIIEEDDSAKAPTEGVEDVPDANSATDGSSPD